MRNNNLLVIICWRRRLCRTVRGSRGAVRHPASSSMGRRTAATPQPREENTGDLDIGDLPQQDGPRGGHGLQDADRLGSRFPAPGL